MIEPERDAPDLEDLAAYLDGRLSDELKARVEERLARDEDYYEVFVENVRFQQEEECRRQQEGGGGEVVAPAVWWRSRRAAVAAPVAAAAVLVAAIGLPRLVSGPSTEALMARLDPQAIFDSPLIDPDLKWYDPGWDRMRGSGSAEPDPDLERRQELAFRIGTRTIDLRVALAAGDRDTARGSIGQLEDWTGDLYLAGLYAQLSGKLTTDPIDVLQADAAHQEETLEEVLEVAEARHYALGRWNEAGRLAALAGDAEVLRGLYRRRPVAGGIEDIDSDLVKLEKALEPSPPDFTAAGKAFSEIARALAGRG